LFGIRKEDSRHFQRL